MSVRAGKSFDKLLPNWKDRALKAEKQLEAAIDERDESHEVMFKALAAKGALEAQLAAVNIAIENRWQFGQDGDSWYATQYDFINLQSSESGWGDTPVDAIIDLTAAIGDDS